MDRKFFAELGIREIPLSSLGETIPQVIFNVNVHNLGLNLEKGHDDLDRYVGTGVDIQGHRFAVMHYAGYPQGTTTIRLPSSVTDLNEIHKLVQVFMNAFDIPMSDVLWERSHSPDL